jgi:hypothetical protein
LNAFSFGGAAFRVIDVAFFVVFGLVMVSFFPYR